MIRPLPVLATALLVGSLDLIYISLFWQLRAEIPPVVIAQSVAAGWLGRETALSGGNATAALGLASHYAIACAMALAPALLARRHRALLVHPLRSGIAYGMSLYLLMNGLVAPLSAAAAPLPRLEWMQVPHLLAHVLLVGVPCVWAARYAIADAPVRPRPRLAR